MLRILAASLSYCADIPKSNPKNFKQVVYRSSEDKDSGWDARFEAISDCRHKAPSLAKKYFPSSARIAIPPVLDDGNNIPIFALNDSIKLDFSVN